jgi:diguanylate cyclase (GGDEF)-like protein
MTISIGVARWQPDEDLENLINRADQAMYAAKKAGRNQVQAKRVEE